MAIYEIVRREETLLTYDIEADSPREALDSFYQLLEDDELPDSEEELLGCASGVEELLDQNGKDVLAEAGGDKMTQLLERL